MILEMLGVVQGESVWGVSRPLSLRDLWVRHGVV